MVNYCCVYGCGRNSKVHKHLTYYSVPKSKERKEQWLRAAGREDLLRKTSFRSVRLCSRHFEPTQIKKRHLVPDAIPTLCLPGSKVDDEIEPEMHNGTICNSCSVPIVGFRYKCLMCHDYDLCQKCEMLEVHPHHLMLRINKPMQFINTSKLVKTWHDIEKYEQGFDAINFSDEDNSYVSSDDEPITKYTKESDSGIDLPEEVKNKIRKEIARALKCKKEEENINTNNTNKKRLATNDKPSKRFKKGSNGKDPNNCNDIHEVEELAFADVDDVKIIKSETIHNSSSEQDCESIQYNTIMNEEEFI